MPLHDFGVAFKPHTRESFAHAIDARVSLSWQNVVDERLQALHMHVTAIDDSSKTHRGGVVTVFTYRVGDGGRRPIVGGRYRRRVRKWRQQTAAIGK